MDSCDDTSWDFIDYSLITDTTSTGLTWMNNSVGGNIDSSLGNDVYQQGKKSPQNDCTQKRLGIKAYREKLRRKQLNDSFLDLSSILEPRKPGRIDKLLIMDDAIKVVKKLRNEAQELEIANRKLHDDIRNLKAEKKELHEEKVKARAEMQMKKAQQPGFGGYGFIPMWQYLPQSALDTSHDHRLRPPAA